MNGNLVKLGLLIFSFLTAFFAFSLSAVAKPLPDGSFEVAQRWSDRLLNLAHGKPQRDGEWTLLGRESVNFYSIDKDTLRVGQRFGVFQTLRLDVLTGEIFIARAKVIFGNGSAQVYAPRRVLHASGSSLIFDLTGGDRYISKIVLTYRGFKHAHHRPKIAIWGTAKNKFGSAQKRTSKLWKKFGPISIPLRRKQVVVRIAKRTGAVDSVRLATDDGNIRVFGATLVFGNGFRQELNMPSRIRGGEATNVLEIKDPTGLGRHVDRVLLDVKSSHAHRQRHHGHMTLGLRKATLGRVKSFTYKMKHRHKGIPTPVISHGHSHNSKHTSLPKRPSGWRVIVDQRLKRRSGTDVFNIVGRGTYVAIRVFAKDAGLSIRDLDVAFGNGKQQHVETRPVLKPGSGTKSIDLKGRARRIKNIRVQYHVVGRGQPRLVIWGRSAH